MLYFTSDYMEGADERILEKLISSNMTKVSGYGSDEFSENAKEKIKKECGSDEAEVYFLVGGTQTNKIVISSILRSFEGGIAADTGHIFVHEAGAIENSGHKVISIKANAGKISDLDIENYVSIFHKDTNKEHMVFPKLVYLSQPTEYGTLYTKSELIKIKNVCKQYNLKLFIDGARLGYALASEENNVEIKDLYDICDVLYIGGTKCGALCGEAVVTKPNLIPNFFTIIKQNGGLLAKGRLLGIQFDVLFTDDIYKTICTNAVKQALRIKNALIENGFKLYVDSPTNQQFVIMDNDKIKELSKYTTYGFMETFDENNSVIRFCTSWATKEGDVDLLIEVLNKLKSSI
jgi:hypothetical protein